MASEYTEVIKIDESDLPMEPEEFSTKLFEEIDQFFFENDMDKSNFERELTDEEMRQGLYTRVSNEVRTVKYPLRLLERIDDPVAFVHLNKQIEDEAKHARLLGKRLKELGGDPSESFAKSETDWYWENIEENIERGELIEPIIWLQGVGERWLSYRTPHDIEFFDDETAQIYEDVIVPDEKFHAQVGVNLIELLCTDEESQLKALEASREIRRKLNRVLNQGIYEVDES